MTNLQAVNLVPKPGFVVKVKLLEDVSTKLYVNFCSFHLMGMPQGRNGVPMTEENLDKLGIANSHIPFDIGSWRTLKTSKSSEVLLAVDVIFNENLIERCLNNKYCQYHDKFRQYLIDLAFKNIETFKKVKIDRSKVNFQKTKYTGMRDGEVVQFTPIYPDEDTKPTISEKPAVPEKPLITEEKPAAPRKTAGNSKPVMKAGFLNKNSKPLYPNGSPEGVLPENAGDPMGWLPKGLRKSCQIVDTTTKEYQAKEKAHKEAEENRKATNEMLSSMLQSTARDIWGKDSPMEDFDEILNDIAKLDTAKPKKNAVPEQPKKETAVEKPQKETTTKETKKDTVAQKNIKPGEVVQPDYKIQTDDDKQQYIISIELPACNTVEEVRLKVIKGMVRVTVRGKYLLTLDLPETVNHTTADAKFYDTTHLLELTMDLYAS